MNDVKAQNYIDRKEWEREWKIVNRRLFWEDVADYTVNAVAIVLFVGAVLFIGVLL